MISMIIQLLSLESMEKNETKYEEHRKYATFYSYRRNSPSENIGGVLTGGNMAIIVTTLGTQYRNRY